MSTKLNRVIISLPPDVEAANTEFCFGSHGMGHWYNSSAYGQFVRERFVGLLILRKLKVHLSMIGATAPRDGQIRRIGPQNQPYLPE